MNAAIAVSGIACSFAYALANMLVLPNFEALSLQPELVIYATVGATVSQLIPRKTLNF